MSLFTVALLQMNSVPFDQEANRAKGVDFSRRAKAMGADLALFPEMWNIGYAFPDSADPGAWDDWTGRAVSSESPWVVTFRDLARELEMAIAVTYLEKWPGLPRNTVTVFDRHGESVLTYAKVHTCDFDVECQLTPGEGFEVADLDTEGGTVRIGAMICFDREHPESARILMLKGAEIILTPNACGLEMYRLMQFRVRAWENMVGVAMANYAAPQENGHSVAYDPMAFPPEDGPPRDNLVVEAGEVEGIYLARFDMDAIRDYRQREALGNAYRKPGSYGPLTETGVAEPFIRKDAKR